MPEKKELQTGIAYVLYMLTDIDMTNAFSADAAADRNADYYQIGYSDYVREQRELKEREEQQEASEHDPDDLVIGIEVETENIFNSRVSISF